jgi:hypothetical protein
MFSKENWADSQNNLAGNGYELEMDSVRGYKKEISDGVREKFEMGLRWNKEEFEMSFKGGLIREFEK